MLVHANFVCFNLYKRSEEKRSNIWEAEMRVIKILKEYETRHKRRFYKHSQRETKRKSAQESEVWQRRWTWIRLAGNADK